MGTITVLQLDNYLPTYVKNANAIVKLYRKTQERTSLYSSLC